MSQTPIYEEVRRVFGRPDRGRDRRPFAAEDAGEPLGRSSRPVMLRAGGGRHRRPGEV